MQRPEFSCLAPTPKPGILAHVYNTSTEEMETGQPGVCSVFKFKVHHESISQNKMENDKDIFCQPLTSTNMYADTHLEHTQGHAHIQTPLKGSQIFPKEQGKTLVFVHIIKRHN